jgi:hypothetical protein
VKNFFIGCGLSGLLLAIGLAYLLFSGSSTETPPPQVTVPVADSAPATPDAAQEADLDKGDFKIAYEKPDGETEQQVYLILKDDDTFKNLLAQVNDAIALPIDIPVRFRSCGEANAFYDPERKDISMCYELFIEYIKELDDNNLSDEELGKKVIEAATFIMFHEMGHSFVDNFDIPITGKEEDAVDDFAAVFAVKLNDEGEEIVAASIDGFAAWAAEEGTEDLSFEDEHSLSAQRFYTIACVLYGSNPEKFADMVGDDYLPKDRAERCPAEYEQKSKSWEVLMGKHLKNIHL